MIPKKHKNKLILAETSTDQDILDTLSQDLSCLVREKVALNKNISASTLKRLCNDSSSFVRTASYFNDNIKLEYVNLERFKNQYGWEIDDIGLATKSYEMQEHVSSFRNHYDSVGRNEFAHPDVLRKIFNNDRYLTDNAMREIITNDNFPTDLMLKSLKNLRSYVEQIAESKNMNNEIAKTIFDKIIFAKDKQYCHFYMLNLNKHTAIQNFIENTKVPMCLRNSMALFKTTYIVLYHYL